MATMSTSISRVSLAGQIAARTYLRGLAATERGDFDQVLSQFRPDCELVFIGRTALGARLSGQADLLRWFERVRRLLPDPSFDVRRLVIGGRSGTSTAPRMSIIQPRRRRAVSEPVRPVPDATLGQSLRGPDPRGHRHLGGRQPPACRRREC